MEGWMLRRRGCLVALAVGLLILLSAAVVAAVAIHRIRSAAEPMSPGDDRKIHLTLDSGLSGRQVARELQANGVIADARLFSLIARMDGYDGRFQAGDYVLMPSMSAREIMEALVHGRSEYVAVTIPEGYTLRQVAARLEELDLCTADAFEDYAGHAGPISWGGFQTEGASLEGYLFPDTYYVPVSFTPEQIAGLMLDRFREVVIGGLGIDIARSPMWLHEIVTLASIVEREAKLPEERPTVAQVFLSRIKKGWRLESCATVQYLLGKPVPVITAKEQAIDSPYNTYLYPGLPPGPIGSPGASCVDAVLHPASTDYLFFRTRGDGGHYFTRTLQEHLAVGE